MQQYQPGDLIRRTIEEINTADAYQYTQQNLYIVRDMVTADLYNVYSIDNGEFTLLNLSNSRDSIVTTTIEKLA